MKTDMIADIKQFIDSKEWYSSRGLPYRRGYLLYGPPGCGKSSVLFAIAGHFHLNICCLSLNSPDMNDTTLTRLMQSLPTRAAVLLEDVDCLFVDRKSGEDKARVSFSALLNAIDGVNASEGRIIFMTTNHKDKLSKALIRPGRIDRTYLFDLASKSQLREMFGMFFAGKEKEAVEFAEAVPDRLVSPAAVQGHLLNYRDSPRDAIDKVTELLLSVQEKTEEKEKVEEKTEEKVEEKKEEKTEEKIEEKIVMEKVDGHRVLEEPSGAVPTSA